MNSDGKTVSICTFFLFTALVAIVFMVSKCNIEQTALDNKVEIAQLELKRDCARNGGEWSVITRDRQWDVEYCKMPR